MSHNIPGAVGATEPDAQELRQLLTLGRLVSSVGRELQQPIAVIRNAVYFLNMRLGESLDDKVRKHMSLIWQATETASNSVSDLLGFAEQEDPQPADVSPGVLVLDALSRAGIPPHVHLTTLMHDSLPNITADPLQMVRVLVKLFNNAVEAMPDHGTLTITGAVRDGEVTLEIADTGTGIPSDDLALVAEPMFTTKPGHKGLGLAIARSLTERNGGRLVIRSVPGRGTTVVLSFPCTTTYFGAGVEHGK
jgi:signal transduction histidine kinase